LDIDLGLRAGRFTPGYHMTGFQPSARIDPGDSYAFIEYVFDFRHEAAMLWA